MAERMPIVSKESVVPIVDEPSLQEDKAPRLEVTPTVAEPDVPIIEESLPQENMAPGTETTFCVWCPEVATLATTVIESEVLPIDPPARPIELLSLSRLTKGNL